MLKVEKQFAERLIKLLNESMYTVAFDVKILFEKLTEQLNAWQCDEALLLHVYQALTEKKTLNYTHIFFEGIWNHCISRRQYPDRYVGSWQSFFAV